MAHFANPVEELKSLRDELTSFTVQYKAGDSVPANEAARLDYVIARGAELAEAIQRGEKSAGNMAAIAAAASRDELGAPGAKTGYLDFSRARVSQLAAKMAEPGVKALLAGGSTGTAVTLDPTPLRTPGARQAAGLLSYFEVKQQDAPDYRYIRQTVRTSAAAVVAPGGVKPTSTFTTEDVTGHLDVIAHLSEYVDKFLLEDNAELRGLLEVELRDGVLNAAEKRALATIAAASGIQTVTTSAGLTAYKGYDAVHNGIVKSQVLGYEPDLIVMNPTDYETLRLGKNGQNDYVGGSPFDGSGDPRLWDRETFVTAAQPQGKVLVLPTAAVRVSTDTQGIRTDVDAFSGFDRNQVRFRTEGRFTADVRRPAGIVLVTLTA